MRLTVRTNIAMRALMSCAMNPTRIMRKAEIAKAVGASEAHLGVVINQLSQTGFIETLRGRHGGIRLKFPPQAISVGRVFRIFEASTPFTECFSARDNHCPIASACKLRSSLDTALEAFYSSLDAVTLEDLTCGNTGLERLLSLEPAA
ncbi:RrF2 family transcriptional regulator [Nioella nitratireducens]|uniref:RrF2 family transcriptional regulator n=1 Tax=Nioella nitratireducens TaxID=1287720 RepID=UPI0008FD8EE9|nr:Rrf2 family transcriptional regulator [Nioella nitratireducens]